MFWTLLTFSNKIIFRVSKRCSEALEQYFFLRLLGSHREKEVDERVCLFSTTDVFVPVSQLSTRDLFYFLESLKIKQDIFFLSWISRPVRSVEQRALWFPYSRLSFRNSFQEGVISWIFYKVNCGVHLGFWYISFRKMFELLTCKKNHNFWVSGVMFWMSFIFKRLRDMASLWDVIRHFVSQGGVIKFFSFDLWREKPL